jgi:UDP-hydrolysing UDP-N-acetyl-D-glucosamine 2-epimerase
LAGFSSLFQKRQPDLVIVLGDRYELWALCIAAVIHKIPIVHLHGGESTLGLIDDPVRHSVTKMSTFHFASIEAYAKRIIQMGENPNRVYVVGALGIDNIKNMRLMDIREVSEYTGVDFGQKNVALLTYHPVTLDDYTLAGHQTQEILEALIQTTLFTLITMPNADTGGNTIYQIIEMYSQKYPDRFRFVKSLGQQGYLSAMKYAKLMIGNSSSGIIESASFKLPVINIGDRQGGRFKPANVIDCVCSIESIMGTLDKALSEDFTRSILDIENPYGDGTAAKRIVNILRDIDLSDKSTLIKKGFYDIDFPAQFKI